MANYQQRLQLQPDPAHVISVRSVTDILGNELVRVRRVAFRAVQPMDGQPAVMGQVRRGRAGVVLTAAYATSFNDDMNHQSDVA